MHYIQEQYVSLIFQTRKSHFSADFQGQKGLHILCNPNDDNRDDLTVLPVVILLLIFVFLLEYLLTIS